MYTRKHKNSQQVMEVWIGFDPSESGVDELDNFLEKNAPSVVKRSDGVRWISVLGPQHLEKRRQFKDEAGLQQAWKAMQESGRPITSDTLCKLAQAHNCLSGKWLFFIDTGFKVDYAWAKIARAVVSGQCGMSAKVSSYDTANKSHVICVYNSNFTDQEAVFDMENRIRRAGIKCNLGYKPDAFTSMGIYSKNKWKLRQIIYTSDYDLNLGRSKVTAV